MNPIRFSKIVASLETPITKAQKDAIYDTMDRWNGKNINSLISTELKLAITALTSLTQLDERLAFQHCRFMTL